MSAQAGAAFDQVHALFRDQTPGTLIAVADRLLFAASKALEIQQVARVPMAEDIDLMVVLAALCGKQVADTLGVTPADRDAARAAVAELLKIIEAAKVGPR